jgi:hypothetical protein
MLFQRAFLQGIVYVLLFCNVCIKFQYKKFKIPKSTRFKFQARLDESIRTGKGHKEIPDSYRDAKDSYYGRDRPKNYPFYCKITTDLAADKIVET